MAVIATPDRLHLGPALAFAALGYHLLVEKPMAVDEEECRHMARVVQQAGVLFAVAHVLRSVHPRPQHTHNHTHLHTRSHSMGAALFAVPL